MAGGTSLGNRFGRTTGPINPQMGGLVPPSVSNGPITQFGAPSNFSAAANTQASDYDTIMKNYSDLLNRTQSNPIQATPVSSTNIAPQTAQYSQSPDVSSSISNLGGLAADGGYSTANIADIRARDISPIRSIYSSAQQNIERSKALQGGYSPNYTAATAKLTRDEAQQVDDVNSKANADIAQNVATNRLSAASPYASASANANAAKTQADQNNAAIVNQINQTNANNQNQVGEFNSSASLDAAKTNTNTGLSAIQGQNSLYGTTPALTNTFGNQVTQAGQLGLGQQQINNQRLNTIGSLAR